MSTDDRGTSDGRKVSKQIKSIPRKRKVRTSPERKPRIYNPAYAVTSCNGQIGFAADQLIFADSDLDPEDYLE